MGTLTQTIYINWIRILITKQRSSVNQLSTTNSRNMNITIKSEKLQRFINQFLFYTLTYYTFFSLIFI